MPFDLRPILADLLELYRGAATTKGLVVTLALPEGGLIGLGDPFRLRQVAANFLSNAIKFTSQGSVSLGAGLADDGAGGRVLTVSVTDTGQGIKPEVAARLFQPFTQGDVSTSRKFGGTGLGLVICKRIAEAMGGGVGLDSAEGAGATFRISLPFPATDLPPVNAQAEVKAAAPAAGQKRTPRRVLLADDDEVNRQVISGMLRRAGHEIATVEDGRQAVDAVLAGDFDLVLMDMQMPVMDGPEATRAIRALQPPKSTIPIIGLTADALIENRGTYLMAGLDELLTKPIRAVDLVAAVDRVAASGRRP